MHADKVGLRQQCIHSPKFHLQLFLHLFCRAHRIRVNHLHLETACAPRHRSSNPTATFAAMRRFGASLSRSSSTFSVSRQISPSFSFTCCKTSSRGGRPGFVQYCTSQLF